MVHIVIAAGTRRERQVLREAAISHPNLRLVGVARDGQEAVQLAVQYRPDAMILTDDLKILDGYLAAGLISAATPEVKCILVVDTETPEVIRRAMQMGVRECIGRPVVPVVILEAVLQTAELGRMRERPEYQTALDPESFPRVVVVSGAKGGIGKTSTATNLAVALAQAGRGPTVLVDMYTQFGDVSTMLNVSSPQTLVDLANVKEEIDLSILAPAIAIHSSDLHVLLGSSTPQALDALPVHRLEQVFSALRQRYRFIVVDVPNMLHAGTVHVLETAHVVLLICNAMDLTAVADTRRWLEAIQVSFISKERVRLVLNRVCRQQHLPVEKVEQSLGLKAWACIPNDFRLVSQCANRGVPYVLEAPKHPASQAVRQIAQALIHDWDGAEPLRTEKQERRSLFRFSSGALHAAPEPERA